MAECIVVHCDNIEDARVCQDGVAALEVTLDGVVGFGKGDERAVLDIIGAQRAAEHFGLVDPDAYR